MLGEITHDDTTYTGDAGADATTLQFYRNKASEFQAVMESVAVMRVELEYLLPVLSIDENSTAMEEALAMLAEIDAKKPYIVAAAEALNLASSGANAMGVRFPMLSVPSGLGLAPAALAMVAGAVAGVAALTYWGKTILNTWRTWLINQQAIDAAPSPEGKQKIAEQIVKAQAAIDHADNPLSQTAGIIKWIAIAGLGYLAFRMWQNRDVRGYHGYS